ncbi:MAG: nucleotidyl transferase AbiEii/AbiGii toxin family protein [Bdellovibrionota bacterium]
MSPKNIAISVRQKLLNIANQQGKDFQLILIRYALERLLYRLSMSEHKNRFVLKGAMLFVIWNQTTDRPTRDIDFLGKGDNSLEGLKKAFVDICHINIPEDGIVFLVDSIKAERINEAKEYEGTRILLKAELASAIIPIQIDIGFGDVITPGPKEVAFPTILDSKAPIIQTYTVETVIAEKFHAIVHLGMANSRIKDYFDLWVLLNEYPYDQNVLKESIQNTFEQRKTKLPTSVPIALTSEFTEDKHKKAQWKSYVAKNKLLENEDITLDIVSETIALNLMPLLK